MACPTVPDLAIPDIVLAFAAVIPDLEFALSLDVPSIPFAIPNMILAALLPSIGLPVIELLNVDFEFEMPDIDIPDFDLIINAIIDLVIGIAAIPIGMIMIFLDLEAPTPEITLELLLASLPVPPLTVDAALTLTGCLAEVLGVSDLM